MPLANEEPKLIKIWSRNSDKIVISSKHVHHIITKSEINYLKSEGNYCELFLNDNSSILCSRTLKDVASTLSPELFLRVHNSYVINIQTIRSIEYGFHDLTLQCGTVIPISRGKKETIKKIIKTQFD